METPIDFYRHFSWLKKVSAELWFHFFVSFLVSHSFLLNWCLGGVFHYFLYSGVKSHVYRGKKKGGSSSVRVRSLSPQLRRMLLSCSYCVISRRRTVFWCNFLQLKSRGCISTCCSADRAYVCAWRHASQGLCYLIKGIIHQLIVVDKAASDTAGFNQRETLPPESRAVVRTWSFRNNSVEFRLCFCFVSEFYKRIIVDINQHPPKSVWIRQMSLYLSSRQCFFFYFFFYCGLQLTYTDHSFDTTLWYDGLNQTEKSVKKNPSFIMQWFCFKLAPYLLTLPWSLSEWVQEAHQQLCKSVTITAGGTLCLFSVAFSVGNTQ